MSDGFTGLRVSPATKQLVAGLSDRLIMPQHLVVEAAIGMLDRATAAEQVETAAQRAARLAGAA